MTYLIKAILHNNLAGLGPDRGEEDMQFLVSQERHGADTQDIKAGPVGRWWNWPDLLHGRSFGKLEVSESGLHHENDESILYETAGFWGSPNFVQKSQMEETKELVKSTCAGQVSVRAMSAYTPHSASWNGMQGDFASINQMPGQDVKLRFQSLG
jgi:hypothetical protein